MNCQNSHPLLSKYVDDELNTRDTALVYEHLNQCRPCKEELEALQGWEGIFSSTFEDHPFGDFLSQKIMVRVKEENLYGSLRSGKISGKILPFFTFGRLAFAASLLLVLSIFAFLIPPQGQNPPKPRAVATLKSRKALRIFRESQGRWITSQGSSTLYSGDQIWNSTGAPCSIILQDSSRITLDGKSRISVALGNKGWKIHLLGNRARAFFQVAPQQGHSFVVQAEKALVEVIGTVFVVEIQSKRVMTTVFKGRVKMATPQQKPVYLTCGQESMAGPMTPLQIFALKDKAYRQRANWIPGFTPPALPAQNSLPPVVRPPHRPSKPLSPPRIPPKTGQSDTPIQVQKPKKAK